MKRFRSIATFVLIGIMVMSIGALAGWYLVLKSKGQTINWQDAARGFGLSAPSSGANGSTYENIGGSIGGGGGSFNVGGGTGVNGPGGASSEVSGGANSFGGTSSATEADAEAEASARGASSTSQAVSGLTRPKTSRLWHVTKTPVAGYGFSSDLHEFFFTERATGYIFKADAWSGEVLRRTNTLIPKVYQAYFNREGSAIYRTLNETTGVVQTFTGIIGTSTSASLGTFVGENLANSIHSIAASPSTGTLFAIYTDGTKTVGATSAWTPGKVSKETRVFSSSVGSWKPIILSDGRLVVVQRPQDGVPGTAFVVKDGALTPMVHSAPGLTFLPLGSSNAFVFGTSGNTGLSLYAQTSSTTFALPIKTVADKCAWSPYVPATRTKPASDMIIYCAVPSDSSTKNFLSNWYMGALHTKDAWWRINLTTGKSEQILSSQSNGADLDVVDPVIDPNGELLAFKNGVDGSLWVLRIAK